MISDGATSRDLPRTPRFGFDGCPIAPNRAIRRDVRPARLIRSGHRAYLVGGCVRDLLLGSTPKDFRHRDVGAPRQVKKVFRNSRSSDDASGSCT